MSKEKFIWIPKHKVELMVRILAETLDYNHRLMNIPAMWKRTMGEGVKVAILDTGMPNHVDIVPSGGKGFVEGCESDFEDLNGHGCVAPDTLVHTNFCGIEQIETLYNRVDAPEQIWRAPDGTESWVKDVRAQGLKTYALDEQTGKAVVSPIEYLHRTPVHGPVVRVKLAGQIELGLTPWHEVCTLEHMHHDKYRVVRKRADALSTADRFIYPVGPAAGNLVAEYYRVAGAVHRVCAACGHVLATYKPRVVRCQCKRCGKSKWIERADMHLVTEPLAYLAGLVLTDGHIVHGTRQHRVEISSVDADILEGALTAAESLGFHGKIDRPLGRCARAIIDSRELATLLVNGGLLSGCKTYTQTLPEFVGKSPRSVQAAFVAGVVDGDGCISITNTKNHVTSVSLPFVKQFTALLNSLGVTCGYQDYGPSTAFGRNKDKTDTGVHVYNCTFTALPNDIVAQLRCERKRVRARRALSQAGRFARAVAGVSTENYDGYFYDLTVKGHHTYVGNGHFVSNTHCGGIVAATANNGIGVAGIAPNCDDYYGQVLNDDGGGSFDDIVKGIYWAVDELGADVISMSLGVPAGAPYMKEMENACDHAVAQGCAVFAAAGNEGGWVGQPAVYDSVIAVAAVNNKEQHANFSNSGPEVDFAAGGVDVFSTYLDNSYAKLSGTSMATPALAGLAALILSDARKGANPRKLTPAELKEKIRKIAYNTDTSTGYDQMEGFGIPIFGKGDDPYETPADKPVPPATPVPTPNPVSDRGWCGKTAAGAAALPGVDCLYWQIVQEVMAKVEDELKSGHGLERALSEGLLIAGLHVRGIDRLVKARQAGGSPP